MTYVHHIPGRIRVRVPGIRRNAARANALRNWLESHDGILAVEVNPVTGSVLIRYTTAATDGSRLIAEMREQGWMASLAGSTAPANDALARFVVRCLAEAAIERSIMTLVAAVL